MKTAILYYSEHHGNTKKLLDAIAAKNDVDLIDVTKQGSADLAGYDRIGLASCVGGHDGPGGIGSGCKAVI